MTIEITDPQFALQASGNILAAGSVNAIGLAVPGLTTDSTGAVQTIGQRVAYDTSALTNGSFSQTAATDGTVVAVLGTVSPSLDISFAGILQGQTSLGGSVTSTLVTSAATTPYTYSAGKKGAVTLLVPHFGNLTMPVRKGETWSLTLTAAPAEAGFQAPNLVFYWVPLGSAASAEDGGSSKPAETAAAEIHQNLHSLRANLAGGATLGTTTPDSMAQAQRIIDDRVDDFTRVLGDATGMSASPDERTAFTARLQAIVCRATPQGTAAVPVDDAKVEALVDAFARVTEREFTPEQRSLLTAGILALVEINANERNRTDLGLIKNNITLFLDAVAQALGITFDPNAHRLLTRALVRLVGDGTAPQPLAAE